MIAPEDDDGVIDQAEALQPIHHAAQFAVHERCRSVVAAQGFLDTRRIHFHVVPQLRADFLRCFRDVVQIVGWILRQRDRVERIHVVKLRRGDEWQVRADEAEAKEERFVAMLFKQR